jgi:hypothetical protein
VRAGALGGQDGVCVLSRGWRRTFMREILDTINGLRSKSHWAHLSAGFRADLAWWSRFAKTWNGIEAVPPKVSVPWRWLTSDASGEHGLGVFLVGAALHMPLPLDYRRTADVPDAERELIIAETELIAAVLLVALAAPLFPGEHLLLGNDNQVAIAWLSRGTASRPRAMRALRLLWKIQAQHRVHVTARYIPSESNVLADAASRRDSYRFFRASRDWCASHAASIRGAGIDTNGRTSLVATPYGSAGGAAGLLVEYLVEGHDQRLREQESQVEQLLHTISSLARRFVAQQHRRLHHVSGDGGQEGRSAGLFYDQAYVDFLG